MVSPQMSADGAPCGLCGGEFVYGRHCQRVKDGTKCQVDGCGSRLFERCFGASGEVLAAKCLKQGHVWRKV